MDESINGPPSRIVVGLCYISFRIFLPTEVSNAFFATSDST